MSSRKSPRAAAYEAVATLLLQRGFLGFGGKGTRVGLWQRRAIPLTEQWPRFYISVHNHLGKQTPAFEVEGFLMKDDNDGLPDPRDSEAIGWCIVRPNLITVTDHRTPWIETLARRIEAVEARCEEIANHPCAHCGALMQEREAQKGPNAGEVFLSCLRWPECQGIRSSWKVSVAKDDGKRVGDVLCPDCGALMAVRYARRGDKAGNRFYGCTRYPDCKGLRIEEEVLALRLMGETGAPEDTPEDDAGAFWT